MDPTHRGRVIEVTLFNLPSPGNRICHFYHTSHESHIMDANDIRAAGNADCHSRGSALQPLIGRQVEGVTNK